MRCNWDTEIWAKYFSFEHKSIKVTDNTTRINLNEVTKCLIFENLDSNKRNTFIIFHKWDLMQSSSKEKFRFRYAKGILWRRMLNYDT